MLSIQTSLIIIIRRLTGVGVFVALVVGVVGFVSAKEFVTPQNLIQILKSNDIDSIRSAMNAVKRQHYKAKIIPFIVELWTLNRGEHPDLPWEVIEMPPVRLEVAHILVQAARNGYTDVDITPMHAFARSQVQDGTPQDIVIAMGILTSLRDPADIPILKEVAKKENRITFRMSVIAISEMCAEEKREAALDEISGNLSNEQFRQFMKDYRLKAANYRQNLC